MGTGGPHMGLYSFDSLHFHWGQKPGEGSEHTFANEVFDLEVHLKWNKMFFDEYKDTERYVVIAIWGRERGDRPAYNLNLPTKVGETTQQTLAISRFIPQNLGYYSYLGSFTTPPCTEGVRWLILSQVISIPQDFFKQLRSYPIGRNIRPLQHINGREVCEKYFHGPGKCYKAERDKDKLPDEPTNWLEWQTPHEDFVPWRVADPNTRSIMAEKNAHVFVRSKEVYKAPKKVHKHHEHFSAHSVPVENEAGRVLGFTMFFFFLFLGVLIYNARMLLIPQRKAHIV